MNNTTSDNAGVAKAPAKRKMRPGGGKSKGSGFEGKVAKLLSSALPPLNFIRTQGSGARVGGKNFETIGKMFGADALKLFVGDVTPVNETEAQVRFKFCVETKFYKTPDTFNQLLSGSANIYKWMEEIIIDAAKIDKIPILIFKWNNTPIYAMTLHGDTNAIPNITITTDSKSYDIFLLDDLLSAKDFWTETEYDRRK